MLQRFVSLKVENLLKNILLLDLTFQQMLIRDTNYELIK
jgi:hypothetical protein